MQAFEVNHIAKAFIDKIAVNKIESEFLYAGS
jgi:hypothetical protein